jgi:hypothetical protein
MNDERKSSECCLSLHLTRTLTRGTVDSDWCVHLLQLRVVWAADSNQHSPRRVGGAAEGGGGG